MSGSTLGATGYSTGSPTSSTASASTLISLTSLAGGKTTRRLTPTKVHAGSWRIYTRNIPTSWCLERCITMRCCRSFPCFTSSASPRIGPHTQNMLVHFSTSAIRHPAGAAAACTNPALRLSIQRLFPPRVKSSRRLRWSTTRLTATAMLWRILSCKFISERTSLEPASTIPNDVVRMRTAEPQGSNGDQFAWHAYRFVLVDCVTWILPSRYFSRNKPRISPRRVPASEATAKMVAELWFLLLKVEAISDRRDAPVSVVHPEALVVDARTLPKARRGRSGPRARYLSWINRGFEPFRPGRLGAGLHRA